MYDSGGGGRLTLKRDDEEIITVQRPRSPPFRLPALLPARFHRPSAHHHSPLPSRKLCDESH